MSTAIHVIRLRCLSARIHTSLYCDAEFSTPSKPPYRYRAEQLRGELENWLSSAPSIRPSRDGALSIFATKDWYDLNYNGCILLLYRGLLTNSNSDEDTDDAFLDCLRAAEKICHGYRRQYVGKPVNYTWGALHFLFTAGLTYLHCLCTSSAARAAIRYDEMSSTCTDCTMVLVIMAERWKGAAAYRDIFEVLAGRTMTMMVEENRDRWMMPQSVAPMNVVADEDLSQWRADITDLGIPDGVDELLTCLIGDYASDGANGEN